jgi:hypothetical protein
LTSLRLFLSCAVIVGRHADRLPGLYRLPPILQPMAAQAVSWFFVLSGFVLAYNYPDGRAAIALLNLNLVLWSAVPGLTVFGCRPLKQQPEYRERRHRRSLLPARRE